MSALISQFKIHTNGAAKTNGDGVKRTIDETIKNECDIRSFVKRFFKFKIVINRIRHHLTVYRFELNEKKYAL